MTAQELIKKLFSETEERITICKDEIAKLNIDALLYKENEAEWNALECLDHLHHYAHYYHPLIEEKLKNTSISADEHFNETWLGKQFMKIFDDKKAKKYKAMPRMKPHTAELKKEFVQRFIDEQTFFLELLKMAKKTSLQKNKVPLEFCKLISVSFGDIFQFLSAHDNRHLLQALKVSRKYSLVKKIT